MAIKTVSQLDEFNSGHTQHGRAGIISNDLAFFEDGYLTDNDKSSARAILGTAPNYSSGATKLTGSPIQVNKGTYWSSLFELSKPNVKSHINPERADLYESFNIQYEDILKSVIWDVKSYLNYRNNLNDYNLSAIVEGNQNFKGHKCLTGDMDVTGNIKVVGGISASNCISTYNLTAANLTATNTTTTNLSATNATITSLTALVGKINDLSVHRTLSVDCNISTSLTNLIFDGYAYGLINRNAAGKAIPNSYTTEGTWNGTITASRKDQPNRRGDPVCFNNGRPYELTCVNCAASAYTLINTDGSLVNVGKGEMRTVAGVGGDTTPTNRYKAVYIENGVAKATNVIDFALHAYWSDLGERYLADAEYEPGTLVKFGGEKEITIADNEVNAIVSTKAFDLNACLVGGIVIALCGRVPTKVKGKIQKFDKIMLSDTPGIACKWDGISRVIGRALENNNDEQVKLVECVTKFKL